MTRAQGYFNTAVLKYNNGLKSVAYAQLGRVLHLVQDMGQPGHVQNDPHVPYLGVYSDAFPTGLDGSGASPLEGAVEQLCQQQIASFPSGLSIGTATAGIHSGGGTLTASDYLEVAARASHIASSFPGSLTLQTINLFPVGIVTIGTGTVSLGSISYAANFVDVDTGLGNRCMQVPHWEIIGRDGVTLCYDPSQVYAGSVFSGFSSDWWQIPSSPSDPWNPAPGANRFYFHTYDDVSVGSGGQSATLTAFFTNNLVPSAINSTAGLLEFFGKKVDPVNPTIELRNGDSAGSIIPAGGAGGGTIYVKAVDPAGAEPGGNPAYPTPSGIYKMELRPATTGAAIAPAPAIAAIGENPATRTFPNLAEGEYILKVFDGLGNETQVSFEIRRSTPMVTLGPAFGLARYDRFQGESILPPSAIHGNLEFGVTSTADDVRSVLLRREGGSEPETFDPFVWGLYSSTGLLANSGGVRSLAEIASPVAGVFGLFDENQSAYLPRGLYTLTAETVSGGKTTTPFRLAALAVNHNRSRATYNPASGLFEGRVILDLSSELGLYSAQRHAPSTYETVLSRLFEDPGSATGHPSTGELAFDVKPATASTTSLEDSVVVGVTDVEGNTFAYGLSGMVSGPTWIDEVSGLLRFGYNSSTAGVLGGGMIRDPELSQVLVTSGPGVTGTYLSPVFNAFERGSAGGGALPGSVMPIGPPGLLMTTYIGTFTPVEVGLSSGSLVRNRPMSDRVAVGKVKFTLFSNDLAGAVSASEKYVYEQEIFASTWAPPLPEPPFSLQEVNRFYQLKVELTEYLDGGILRYDCLVISTSIPNFCESGRARRPAVSSVGTPLHGINFGRFSGPRHQAALGSSSVDVGVPLGSAVKLSGVTTRPNLGPVNFFLTQGTLRAEEGYKAVPTATAFDIQPEQASSVIVGSVTVTFNYAFANLTPGQESMLRVARYRSLFRKRNDLMDQNPGSDVADAIIDTARHSVSFKTAQLGTFILMAPIYQNPCQVSKPGIVFLSDGCGPTIEEVDESAGPVATAMKIALARGLVAVAKVFQLGPTGLPFNPAGTVKMTYSDQELDRLGVKENDLALYQFTTAGSFQRLPNLTVDAEHNVVTARVGQFSSLFTIMAGTNAVLIDGIPPSTQLVFDGTSTVDGSGTILIGSRTSVGFEAIDFNEPGLEPIGVFETHYLVDQPFLSTSSTPGQTFSVPFFLPAGRHSLVYFSADRAGNYETPKTAQIEVASSTDTGGGGGPPPSPETAPGRGLAISKDSQDGLWMILQDTSSVISLAKFKSTGVFEGGLPLPGAGDFGAWRIGFDDQGNAVAVGSSMGEATGPDVAVYRVSPEGSLLSTAAFDAGLGAADVAMDASGDLWIAGAVQTGGTETDIRAQLALWRYTPQDGLKLKSLYAGPGGLDAGFGVRLDGSGNVWIVGFSSNPATPGPNKLDLALWKYEATGSSLTAGPFRKPGYARGIGETTNAKLAISNGAVYLAAGKLNGAGNMDLAVAKHDGSGVEIWSRSWHSDPVGDEVPASILSSPQGLSIAGGVFRGQDRPLAVWRYSLDGTLLSAETSSGVGKANDMASNSEGTWLAVEGRGAPFKFTEGASLPGSGDGQAPQDTLPPRTALVVGEPKSETDPIVIATFTSLGFSAVDDLAVVGDGAGSGVRETHYLVDVDPQSCEGVPRNTSAPRGTCANSIYGSTFTLAPGTHTITYLSRDNAGNSELPGTVQVRVEAAPACALTPSGAVGWWDGDRVVEGLSIDLASENDAALRGGLSLSAGKVGRAFSFDGTDDTLRAGAFTALDGRSAATFEFWTKVRALSSGGGCNSGSCDSVFFGLNDTTLYLALDAALKVELGRGTGSDWGSPSYTTSDAALTGLGEWNHVAVTVNGTEDRFYVNGALSGVRQRSVGTFPTLGGLILGAGFNAGYLFLDGWLDEVTIYDRALGPEEIASVHAAGEAGKCKPGDLRRPALTLSVQGEESLRPILSASFRDELSGINTASLSLRIDGQDYTPQAFAFSTGAVLSLSADLAKLALWKYCPNNNGLTLKGGPFLRPEWLAGMEGEINAKLEARRYGFEAQSSRNGYL